MYRTATNHLLAFELTRKRKLEFDDIAVEFHADYTEFLISKIKLSHRMHSPEPGIRQRRKKYIKCAAKCFAGGALHPIS